MNSLQIRYLAAPLLALALLITAPPVTVLAVDRTPAAITVSPSVEIGFVDIPAHTLRLGRGTDTFNYVTEGGQDILFPFQRYRIDAAIGTRGRHRVGLLYQPLTFETVSQFEEERRIDTETFEAGQVVDIVYSFDFWRASYTYRIVETPVWEVDTGASFQIRNASIRFQAQEGDELVLSQDTGPVPVLRARGRYTMHHGWWLEAEADGFYASSAFINGAEYPFTGWIWDAAVSAGAPVHKMAEVYLTLRSIGGGAQGTSTGKRTTWTESLAGDDERYTSNAITTVAVTTGIRVTF